MATAVRARKTALSAGVAQKARERPRKGTGPELSGGTHKIHVGVSSCLLGEKVRFDGNHKFDSCLVGTLGRFFELKPVCPEVAIGLGVPREPIRLVGDPKRPRALGVHHLTLDVTGRLSACGQRMARKLADISGYIFKSGSPSCGLEQVKVFAAGGVRHGRGVYAAAFLAAHPLMPVLEEGQLGDPVLRGNFVERVFAYHRWQRLVSTRMTAEKLAGFHRAHRLSLMAHSRSVCRELDRLVARLRQAHVAIPREKYIRQFMQALAKPATRSGHGAVLRQLAGYIKKHLDAADRAELLGLINDYRAGRAPLIVPISVLRHHFRRHPHPDVAGQFYLDPPSAELVARNSL